MTDSKKKSPLLNVGTPIEQSLFNNSKYYIHMEHLPTGEEVTFKALLTQFEDQFSSEWNTERTFGRMDPIRSFQGTQRIISLGWDVVAAGIDEAFRNLNECSKLLSMLYPTYDAGPQASRTDGSDGKWTEAEGRRVLQGNDGKSSLITPNNASTIKAAPLFRLKFANLIQSAKHGPTATGIETGLIGSIDGLTYAPDLEQGFFDPEPGVLYPQTIKLAFGFYVAHDHALGWDDSQKSFRSGTEQFPRTAPKLKKDE